MSAQVGMLNDNIIHMLRPYCDLYVGKTEAS